MSVKTLSLMKQRPCMALYFHLIIHKSKIMKLKNILLAFSLLIILQKASAQENGDNYRNTNYSSFMPNGNRADSMEVRVWPNPAKEGVVNIYVNSLLQEQKGEVIIYNNSGYKLLAQNVGYGTNQVNIGNAPNGLYYVRIIRENGVATTTNLMVAK
jgi:hypothetical protein